MKNTDLKTSMFGYDRVAVCRHIQELEDKYYRMTLADQEELEQLREQTRALEKEREELVQTLEKQLKHAQLLKERTELLWALEKQKEQAGALGELTQALIRRQKETADLIAGELLPALEYAARLGEQLSGRRAEE